MGQQSQIHGVPCATHATHRADGVLLRWARCPGTRPWHFPGVEERNAGRHDKRPRSLWMNLDYSQWCMHKHPDNMGAMGQAKRSHTTKAGERPANGFSCGGVSFERTYTRRTCSRNWSVPAAEGRQPVTCASPPWTLILFVWVIFVPDSTDHGKITIKIHHHLGKKMFWNFFPSIQHVANPQVFLGTSSNKPMALPSFFLTSPFFEWCSRQDLRKPQTVPAKTSILVCPLCPNHHWPTDPSFIYIHMKTPVEACHLSGWINSGQFITTSAEVTPNGGLVLEIPWNPLISGKSRLVKYYNLAR